MILLIDNYDSFSYNLVQMAGSINPDIKVIRNDAMTVEEIRALRRGCAASSGRNPDPRRVSRTSGHLRSIRLHHFSCKTADARKKEPHPHQ
mgnify:CR=1 FL=1